jgi:rRNA maturation RNase YbeY
MIEVSNHHPVLRFSKKETRRTIRTVLKGVGHRIMRRINRTFLGHRGTTDVISFPLADGIGVDAEVFINLDQARIQAKQYRVSYRNEVRRLLIHGTLHVLGYDDRKKQASERMQRRQEQYLAHLTTLGT